MKTLQEQLDDAWTAIGEAPFPIPEELFEEYDRIQQLILEQEKQAMPVEEWHDQNYCSPYCNGKECWDCAAIRGGCPEDV